MSKSSMVTAIIQTAKANNVHTGGDLFFSLAFRTEAELKKICSELHINTSK